MADTLPVLTAAKSSFWDNKPTATVYQSSAQSIPNNTNTALAFNAAGNDNWNGHSTSTNNSRYTIQVAGTYAITGAYTANATGTGIISAFPAKNGTMLPGSQMWEQVVSNNFLTVEVPKYTIACAVGDYLEIYALQNSGGAENTVPSGCFMTVTFEHF